MSNRTGAVDVAIIGGGIIGATLAYRLARSGARVLLLDRRELGREASWASAGVISPPGPRHGTRTGLALASYAQYPALIDEVEDQTGINVGYVRTGEIEVGAVSDLNTLQADFEWRKTNGVDAEWLAGAAVQDREPALHERFELGVFSPGAGSVMLGRLTVAFAHAARRCGAVIREHAPVTAIVTRGSRATHVETFDGRLPVGAVAIAAGAWSRTLGPSIDFTIPTRPVRGQMMAIADPPVPIRSVIGGGGGYFVPRADGTVAVGATEEHDSGFDSRVTPAGVAMLTALVERVVPSLAHGRLASTWAGLRPGTDDGELILGRVPHLDNVWISSGHFRSGALLAPASADALAASILAGDTDPLIERFDPSRLL
ncbi:MAG TPA: glycine oxidase ThiO [Thermomicrobiales bacterium]|nr:glycine oxidase ThiO [Thermomicrobiales bacterium]